MTETTVPCQECGKRDDASPFAFAVGDGPHAHVCMACRRSIDPAATTPVNRVSEELATLVIVAVEGGQTVAHALFTMSPLAFQHRFPRITKILFPA